MRSVLVCAVLLALAGCDASTEEAPTHRVEPGIVYLDVRGDALVVINGTTVAAPNAGEVSTEPPVVQAGVPFEVAVSTHTGPSPCWEAAASMVSVVGRTATVAVYDSLLTDRTCFLVGTLTGRTDRFVFAEPGLAAVKVEGVREDSGVLRPYALQFGVTVE